MLWQRGHFWITIAGAILWVLRARFLRLDVRRFGTAIVSVPWFVDELVRLAFGLEQSVPARISLGCGAVASAFVQIGAAGGAESFAIIPALHVRRHGEQPGFSYRRPYIEISFVRIVQKNVGVVRFIRAELGEKQVNVLSPFHISGFQTHPPT